MAVWFLFAWFPTLVVAWIVINPRAAIELTDTIKHTYRNWLIQHYGRKLFTEKEGEWGRQVRAFREWEARRGTDPTEIEERIERSRIALIEDFGTRFVNEQFPVGTPCTDDLL